LVRHRVSRSAAVASAAAVGAVLFLVLGIVVVNVVSHSSDNGAHKATPTKSLIPSAIAAKVTPRRRPKVISEANSASCIAANVNQMEWGVKPGRPPAVCP
jgi:hypothetical protein